MAEHTHNTSRHGLLARAPAELALTGVAAGGAGALDGDADAEPDDDGAANQGGEGGKDDDVPWWTPAIGPADCRSVRLTGAS
jgi:hypothetical protein